MRKVAVFHMRIRFWILPADVIKGVLISKERANLVMKILVRQPCCVLCPGAVRSAVGWRSRCVPQLDSVNHAPNYKCWLLTDRWQRLPPRQSKAGANRPIAVHQYTLDTDWIYPLHTSGLQSIRNDLLGAVISPTWYFQSFHRDPR